MNHILIDTNAYSAFMGGDKNILVHLGNADSVYMSVFVIGELLSGFKGGTRERANRKTLNEFLFKPTVKILSASIDTAEFFSSIKNNLRKSGNPLPINDIWIAAHCMESGSMLITYDNHFREIPGLMVWEY